MDKGWQKEGITGGVERERGGCETGLKNSIDLKDRSKRVDTETQDCGQNRTWVDILEPTN